MSEYKWPYLEDMKYRGMSLWFCIAEHLPLKMKEFTAIDVGCGYCPLYLPFKTLRWDMVGIDKHNEPIEWLSENRPDGTWYNVSLEEFVEWGTTEADMIIVLGFTKDFPDQEYLMLLIEETQARYVLLDVCMKNGRINEHGVVTGQPQHKRYNDAQMKIMSARFSRRVFGIYNSYIEDYPTRAYSLWVRS